MSAVLSDDDLVDLTGYQKPTDQARKLAELGLRPMRRRDGRLRITWHAVTLAMLGTESAPDFRFDRLGE